MGNCTTPGAQDVQIVGGSGDTKISELTSDFELKIIGKRPNVIAAPENDEALRKKLEAHLLPGELLAELLKVALVLKTRASAIHMKKVAKQLHHQTSVALEDVKTQQKHEAQAASSREAQIQEGMELLKQRATNFHLRINEMEGDGNCQFRSVSHQLFQTQDFHLYVRHCAIAWLAANAVEFEPFFGGDHEWKQYLKQMSCSRTWGDEITLRALASAFQARLHVLTSTKENWYLTYEPDKLDCPKEVFITYISPIHYNSLCSAE
eukprot:gnl/MRDRNA2_/MRDRNA2_124256_c0_seq1.p1 gnl/MRDRNA2_/MRDRNA2_124256_c0~~gnl/MRDRNA2_/MRDRNA2_124256_c0_seq1.p1  ORF type:complete len:264 (-),score=49.89 gnl/MRDRNA2_/MRDRNA2_124256_c0_seq1:51-842(-)